MDQISVTDQHIAAGSTIAPRAFNILRLIAQDIAHRQHHNDIKWTINQGWLPQVPRMKGRGQASLRGGLPCLVHERRVKIDPDARQTQLRRNPEASGTLAASKVQN